MVLIEARPAARIGPAGELVPLAEQERGRWDRQLIAEGQELVRECLRRNRPGPYQIQAAINAVHSDATTAADTDWGQVLELYDQLQAANPSPVVELNRAVAVAEVDGPGAALALLDHIELDRYHVYYAVRADLLRRLGHHQEAADAYDEALRLTDNEAEREFLRRRRATVQMADTPR